MKPRKYTPEQRERARLLASMRYQSNKDVKRADSLKRAQEVKAWRDSYKLEQGCCDCGYAAHPAALDFDHTLGKTATITHLRSIAAIQCEIAIHKCVVRCARCHRIKTFEERANNQSDLPYVGKKYDLSRSKWRADYKLRLGCYDCGWSEHPAALDFHHQGRKTKGLVHIGTIDAMEREISEGDCIVLCVVCHRVREHDPN